MSKSMHGTGQDRGDSICQPLTDSAKRRFEQHRYAGTPQGTLHAMMGVPGSGKSTVAEKLKDMHNAVRVSPDEIRRMLTGDESNQDRNADVFRIAHGTTRSNLQQGNHVIFDATNVTPHARQNLLDIADETGARKHLHVVDPGLDVAKQRNQNPDRGRVVPDDVIDRMHGQLLGSRQHIPNEGWDEVTYH